VVTKPEKSLNTFVVGNFILTFLGKFSLQFLFAMISVLSIIAHLPLNNITFPANVYGTTDFLIQVVSFDFFPIHEYIDLGFSETEAWNAKFAWLDYDSVNFFECLGSISIFFAFVLCHLLSTLLLHKCKPLCANSFIWDTFNKNAVYQHMLQFMLSTFFEFLISCVVSTRMFWYREGWTYADKLSVAYQFVISFATVFFAVYVTWVLLVKLKVLANHRLEVLEEDNVKTLILLRELHKD